MPSLAPKEYTDYETVQRLIIKKSLFLALGGALAFFALGREDVSKGLALGTLAAVAEFKLMAILLRVGVEWNKRFIHYLSQGLRLGLLAIPLALAIKLPQVNLPAAVVGVFAVKLAIFLHYLIGSRAEPF